MTGANHHNGLKTAILMGGLWSLLLLFGWMLAKGTGSAIWLFIMPLIGIAQTAYSYWNSDKLAVRSMGAIEVTEPSSPPCTRSCASCRRPPASPCRACTWPRP